MTQNMWPAPTSKDNVRNLQVDFSQVFKFPLSKLYNDVSVLQLLFFKIKTIFLLFEIPLFCIDF